MDVVLRALTSPVLPDPGLLKRAGYSLFDLDLAYRRCMRELDHLTLPFLDSSKYRDCERKLKRNYDYLKQQLRTMVSHAPVDVC